MSTILDRRVIERFITNRLKKGIRIKSIRPAEKEQFYSNEVKDALGTRMTEVAYVPETYTFSLALAIYDQKTAFYSSQKESFGFLVESKEFTQLMQIFYDNLWQHSGKLSQRR